MNPLTLEPDSPSTAPTASAHSPSPHQTVHPAEWHWLGRQPYAVTWEQQRAQVAARLAGTGRDCLYLVEHEAVFTIGRRAQESHWHTHRAQIDAAGIPLYPVDRGGSVTYHGPGQLVGYPILRLRPDIPGPRLFVAHLEEALIRTLADWTLAGYRRPGLHGVWIDHAGAPHKIAAVGIRVTRGVTMHGCALNVSCDLQPFSWIVPCGIEACRVTSMAALRGTAPPCHDVGLAFRRHFADLFKLTWIAEDNTRESAPISSQGAEAHHVPRI